MGRRSAAPKGERKSSRPAERDLAHQRILATVDAIPRGCVATYGQVALEAGLPRRARLVGRCLRELPTGTRLAWHRVVNSSGRISARDADGSCPEQRARLEREGVRFDARGRVDLRAHLWRPEE